MTSNHAQFMMRTAVHSGAGSRELIPDLFKGLQSRRVVLFSDRGLEKAGVVEKVVEQFKDADVELAGVFLDIEQDAASRCVNEAVHYFRDVEGDGLLAVGGGSVMDTVKGVKFSLHEELTDIKDGLQGGLVNLTWPEANLIPIPHIAVPTTAGTGSEVSPIAVIYHEELKLKTNIIHPFISADMAVLDPELTAGLPPFITAFTGFDALTHAVEALMSPSATALTDAYALQTIRLIEHYLPQAVENGENIEARLQMLQASLMGITAFSFALGPIPVHNFAHAYGAMFRIPHGLANAVLLPVVMEELPELYLPRIHEFGEALRLKVEGKHPQTVLAEVIDRIRDLQQEVGLPADFSDRGVPQDTIQKTVPAVQKDPAGFAFPLSEKVIVAVGEKVFRPKAISAS
ncbi:MAG: iron-containing alcohol dehydrogenase [Bacillaceae bacterium]|nr:iron-containing alcohol dehydrogenase [Bacillaceae bacterium]